MKPLEFKIEERDNSVNEEEYHAMVFFYEDGTTQEIDFFDEMPEGLECDKHYSIADIYGYKVVDDREGL